VDVSRLQPYALTNRVIFDGLDPDFENRLWGLLTDPRLEHRVLVVSAFRTYEQQKALYDAWTAGTHNVPSVARPGTSRHETGRAADLDISWGAPFGWSHVHAVSADYGLHYPVRGEAWHVETKPGAAPMEEEDMTPEQAKQLNELHWAFVGNRRYHGADAEGVVHDLATPVLSMNHTVTFALTENGQPTSLAGVEDSILAAMPTALDLEQLAEAIVSRLPQQSGGTVVAGPSLEQVKQALLEVLRR
jgi:hypothetical protein